MLTMTCIYCGADFEGAPPMDPDEPVICDDCDAEAWHEFQSECEQDDRRGEDRHGEA